MEFSEGFVSELRFFVWIVFTWDDDVICVVEKRVLASMDKNVLITFVEFEKILNKVFCIHVNTC